MATYSVTIDLNDPDTLAFLVGKTLRVYKSVGTGSTGLPVVWFSENQFSNSLSFTWTEDYGGFVRDGGAPAPGVNVSNVSSDPMNLGDRLSATDSGTVSVDHKGLAGAITVHNTGQRDWMCGMGQIIQNKLSPICAFDLGGVGESVSMMPYEKVLMVFESSRQMDTGTVVARAISASCSVELDGNNLNRAVTFRKDTGWSTNTAGWVTLNDEDLDLVDALFVPLS